MHQQPPYGQWPHQQPPPQHYYPQQYPQQYPQPYQQQPAPRHVRSVERQRGLGGIATSTHLLLTVFTCGLWAFIWIPWAVYRELVPRKKTTDHYY